MSKINEPETQENQDVQENQDAQENQEIENQEIENQEIDNQSQDNIRKLSKNSIINRIMIAGGVMILCFTCFYGITFYNTIYGNGDNKEIIEETTTVAEETTTQAQDENVLGEKYNVFVSKYSDKNVSQSIKGLINNATLNPMSTGLYTLDMKIDAVIRATVKTNKSQYDNVRNIYDYMIYNFNNTGESVIKNDSIAQLCGSMNYKSDFDMELVYRANNILTNFSGDSKDYGCALMLVLRKYGIEAYYIDGAVVENGKEKEAGYVIAVLDNNKYIFDIASEDSISDGLEVNYERFCKAFPDISNFYTQTGILSSIEKFGSFSTLMPISFDAMISNKSNSVFGNVVYSSGYSDGNVDMADGDLYVMLGDTVNLAGTLTGSDGENKWKLVAKIYDNNMNYENEYVVYSDTTSSKYNEASFTANELGNVELVYSVTDQYGRCCTITSLFKVSSYEDITNAEETSLSEDSTTNDNSSETSGEKITNSTDSIIEETTTTKQSETTSEKTSEKITEETTEKETDEDTSLTEEKDETTKSDETTKEEATTKTEENTTKNKQI